MVSFSIKKKEEPVKKVLGFSLKKTNSKLQLKKVPTTSSSPFAITQEDNNNNNNNNEDISIDTVDSTGKSYNQETGPVIAEKKVLIIPNKGNKWMERTQKDLNRNKEEKEKKELQVKEKLSFGINYIKKNQPVTFATTTTTTTINDFSDSDEEETTITDYTNIPISSFGEAMLRGMGWESNGKEKDMENQDEFKRSQYLGLGAKDIFDGEGRAEKEYIPVKLVYK